MFNWKKNKVKSSGSVLRETLFGDMPISSWTGNNSTDKPWTDFQEAKKFIESDNKKRAIQVLEKITETPDLESRHYLQAWHFLRSLGMHPPEDIAKEVYGVLVEVNMQQGIDIVAAYADQSACYLNFSGTAVIWEHPDNSLH